MTDGETSSSLTHRGDEMNQLYQYPNYLYPNYLYPTYTYTPHFINDEVIRQLLKRIADLEARLDAKK